MSSSMALRRSPKPGALTAATFQAAAQLVDDQGRQRLAFDVLSHDDQRTAALNDGLKDRQQRPEDRTASSRAEGCTGSPARPASCRRWSRNTG